VRAVHLERAAELAASALDSPTAGAVRDLLRQVPSGG